MRLSALPQRSRQSPYRARRYRSRHLPPKDCGGGWLATAPPGPTPNRLESSIDADCAVVGAGFTGLAVARRLAELRPDWTIVVLEAGRVGSGASGRSSGFVVDLAGFIAAMPPAHAERFIRLSRAGIAELETLVRTFEIDCAWDSHGFYHVASGEAGLRSLSQLETWLRHRGEDFVRLESEALGEILGTPLYHAGLHMPGSVLVQAGALVRGLARCLPANVVLYESSPVVEITTGEKHTLQAPAGQVTAPRVALALNAYSANLGFLQQRLFPLLTFGSLTRPLSRAEQETLGGKTSWGILAQDPVGSSLRRTADQRLLIRNSLRYARDLRTSEAQLRRLRQVHRRTLAARFPSLAEIDLEHTWAGAMGVSPSHFPFFGQIAEGLLAVGGFTGAGIAMGTVCGRLLAEKLTGHDSDLRRDLEHLPTPRWLPPEPFLGLGIRFRVARMNASGGKNI